MATKNTWLRQELSYNPLGVKNPETGEPYVYASGQSAQGGFLPSNNNSAIVTGAEKSIAAPIQRPTQSVRSKYINPETGGYFTPDEYANYVADRIPKGDVPKTAYDAIMDPNRSTTDLQRDARNLNNARNDLAVGETSMFAGSDVTAGGEQIIYSPAEKEAIRKAAAGIYDPALNDVFARLKERKEEEDRLARREEQIFQTNENIRQWRATTGTKKSEEVNAADLFTQTQLNNGARNAGMPISVFSTLDEDLINFFVQPPQSKNEITGATEKIDTVFKRDIADVKAGKQKTKDVAEAIEGSSLPESVKHWYISQLPLTDVEKENYFSRVWGAVKSIFGQ